VTAEELIVGARRAREVQVPNTSDLSRFPDDRVRKIQIQTTRRYQKILAS